MPTLLIIEDGSGVDGANTYATVADLRAYSTARGLSVSSDDTTCEQALIQACDKLESYSFRGNKVDENNSLCWPRENVYIGSASTPLGSDVIPVKLKLAQCQFAVEQMAGTDLQPTASGREVLRTKVDVIEKEYALGSSQPRFVKAESHLAGLLKNNGASLTTFRA